MIKQITKKPTRRQEIPKIDNEIACIETCKKKKKKKKKKQQKKKQQHKLCFNTLQYLYVVVSHILCWDQ